MTAGYQWGAVRIRCFCSVGCNAYRWATPIEALELGLLADVVAVTL